MGAMVGRGGHSCKQATLVLGKLGMLIGRTDFLGKEKYQVD